MLVKDIQLVKQLRNRYGTEAVMVVPATYVSHIGNKFVKCDEARVVKIIENAARYILRYDAEYSPEFQQIIPYALVSDLSNERYFVAERIAGDDRLLNKYSIGFGGHINHCDGFKGAIRRALLRELSEELEYDQSQSNIQFLGTVRDVTSATCDHLGLVYLVNVDDVKVKENTSLVGYWMTMADLVDNYFKFEGWSRYIIDYLFAQRKELVSV